MVYKAPDDVTRFVLVEGQQDKHFFDPLLAYLGITTIEVVVCGGKGKIIAMLGDILRQRGAKTPAISHIGLVIDADYEPDTFKSRSIN
jgi:hypothetical protein